MNSSLVKHSSILLRPDPARTVIRPFAPGDPEPFADKEKPRTERVVSRVMKLDEAALDAEIEEVMKSLDERHTAVKTRLLRRFEELEGIDDKEKMSPKQAILIGAYFSEEFSFSSAALFNPSGVVCPNQEGVAEGDTRFLLSLRGIGEGHVSSLTFRTGIWRADGGIEVEDSSPRSTGPRVNMPTDTKRTAELTFDADIDISEEVIFPFLPSQGRGIEDVRLCRFTDDDGSTHYRGTFTAFNGSDVRQAMLRTDDFKCLVLRSLDGEWNQAKGMAWFPRRIDGKWFMLGRQDSESVWLLSSDDEYCWNGGEKLISPKFPWEFIQMGNCGSPIELDEGWLVLTHGVGVVRNYCVGAALLDKKDPSKLLGRLETPLLEPDDQDRNGYVPNVVYSCGGFVRDRVLFLPYGVADNFTAFATVDVEGLLKAMR
ncbi:MAG: glycoside hydrolase family 130 protein [Caulobacteraceae bacterium]|nr:glycoside hydrolase family 130 protein [Caulobacter sp.]